MLNLKEEIKVLEKLFKKWNDCKLPESGKRSRKVTEKNVVKAQFGKMYEKTKWNEAKATKNKEKHEKIKLKTQQNPIGNRSKPEQKQRNNAINSIAGRGEGKETRTKSRGEKICKAIKLSEKTRNKSKQKNKR